MKLKFINIILLIIFGLLIITAFTHTPTATPIVNSAGFPSNITLLGNFIENAIAWWVGWIILVTLFLGINFFNFKVR